MTIKEITGKLDARAARIAVVVARFNSFITERLAEGAVDCIQRHGGRDENITLIRVPGSWEIPMAVRKAAHSGGYDGILALGAVIRGDTPHFDYVSAEVSKGIAHLGLETGIPVTFGVLTTDTVEQAIERAGTKAGNKGWDSAMTLLEMIDLMKKM